MALDQRFGDVPHRRYNPLMDEWVLVSPHRGKRPWQGQNEKHDGGERPTYQADCYLCPGNTRAGGARNDYYDSTLVFTNDFAALLDECPSIEVDEANGLIRAQTETGICKVICFSPRHDLTLPQMAVEDIVGVINLWHEQYEELARDPRIGHVMIFENKGEMMGCSNPHPHGQIWATASIPSIARKKMENQQAHFQKHRRPMLLDYLDWELKQGERVIEQNESFVALVPFWAVWPFEAMILPRRAVTTIGELSADEKLRWAEILKRLLVRYDNLFETHFPYSMGLNQRPTGVEQFDGLQMHQSFFPPLLRSATVRKFQVGYEMSGEPQRDLAPEQAAARLRACPDVHFTEKRSSP